MEKAGGPQRRNDTAGKEVLDEASQQRAKVKGAVLGWKGRGGGRKTNHRRALATVTSGGERTPGGDSINDQSLMQRTSF